MYGSPVASEETSHALLDRFVAAGGNFLDTANIYDKSEEDFSILTVDHYLQ